ncbi:MAG: hypothetical protein WCK11_04155 [Candidatus Falkowbacteria bacterium]
MKPPYHILLSRPSGQLLLEVLLVVGIAAAVSGMIGTMTYSGLQSGKTMTEASTARWLANKFSDGLSAVAYSRWQNISSVTKGSSSPLHLDEIDGVWQLAMGTATTTINNIEYAGSIIVEDVCRDDATNKQIVVQSGVPPCGAEQHLDPSTEKVTIEVAWLNGSQRVVKYLTRWRNKVCEQTSWTATSSATSTCPVSTFDTTNSLEASSSLMLINK